MPPVWEIVRATGTLLHRSWQRHDPHQIQAYGARGLLYLQGTGEKLTADDEAVLALLRESAAPVYACQGCMGSMGESISDALANQPLPDLMKRISRMIEKEK